MASLSCQHCGAVFSCKPYQVKTARWCSRTCKHEGQKTHGMFGTPTYNIWRGMVARCTNPNSHRWAEYGARGIKVCDSWRRFENFLADMGVRPDGCSIDRIDGRKGYSPENCRWATDAEQQRNRSNNRPITALGKTLLVVEWAEETGIPATTIYKRLELGWDAERAVTTPRRPLRPRQQPS
jgi:hypothetical protein